MLVLDSDSVKNAKITLILIFTNIFCFILFNLILPEVFLLFFVQINANIIINFEIWRLITPIFFHSDVLHLFSNMIALFIFGASVENNYSRAEYLTIFFISGIIGNLFSLVLLPINSISLGASGAIFGLIGAAFILYALSDRTLLFLSLFYIAYFIISSLAPGINLWAHIFGLLGGITSGFCFHRKRKNRERF